MVSNVNFVDDRTTRGEVIRVIGPPEYIVTFGIIGTLSLLLLGLASGGLAVTIASLLFLTPCIWMLGLIAFDGADSIVVRYDHSAEEYNVAYEAAGW